MSILEPVRRGTGDALARLDPGRRDRGAAVRVAGERRPPAVFAAADRYGAGGSVVRTDGVSRSSRPADRPGQRPAHGRRTQPGHRHRAAAGLSGCGRPGAARALWLPTLFIGPTYYRADGQIQTATGQVQNINRQSLFLGTTAALANGFPAPSPGTGYPQLNGLSSVLRISDAIFEPMAARRVANAQQAGLQATANDTLLSVTEAYFNLQLAAGTLAIAREAAGNAEALTSITAAYAQTGSGLEADHRRALAEFRRRRREIQGAAGQLKVNSALLIRPLLLDPNWVVAPVEPAESVVRLIPDDAPVDSLIAIGLQHRPELAQAQETVKATLIRLKQAKLRPFVPSVAGSYEGGGFGGGQGAFFGNFGARGDFQVGLFWDIRNLGFTDLAICRRRKAENAGGGHRRGPGPGPGRGRRRRRL